MALEYRIMKMRINRNQNKKRRMPLVEMKLFIQRNNK